MSKNVIINARVCFYFYFFIYYVSLNIQGYNIINFELGKKCFAANHTSYMYIQKAAM